MLNHKSYRPKYEQIQFNFRNHHLIKCLTQIIIFFFKPIPIKNIDLFLTHIILNGTFMGGEIMTMRERE